MEQTTLLVSQNGCSAPQIAHGTFFSLKVRWKGCLQWCAHATKRSRLIQRMCQCQGAAFC